MNEIRAVLDAYGIYINYRHLSILVDKMTSNGELTAANRFGARKVE